MGAFGKNHKDYYRWYWYKLTAIADNLDFHIDPNCHHVGEYYAIFDSESKGILRCFDRLSEQKAVIEMAERSGIGVRDWGVVISTDPDDLITRAFETWAESLAT